MKKYTDKFLNSFSLIELMFLLMAISLIMAAYAPVLSQKLRSGEISISNTDPTTECSSIDSLCKLCYLAPKKCLICDRSCETGKTLSYEGCKCN